MIPRTIHRIWVGGWLPKELEGYGQTWKELHPEWTFPLWTEESLTWLQNSELFANAAKIAPNNIGQFRADVARYEILYRFGGVYIDCDFECRKPIDELIENVEAFAAWEQQDVWVNNAILGAGPGHPFFARLIEDLPHSVRQHQGKRPNVMSGPQYLTKLYKQDPMGLHVFDQKLFYPYSWDQLDRVSEDFPDAYGIHHWQNQRARRARRADH